MTDMQGPSVEALNEALAAGFDTADFESLKALYTEDSILLPPRGRPQKGRVAIAAFWSGVRNRFAGMAFTTGDSKLLGEDVARETGTYEMAGGEGGGQQSVGKYIIVWQRIDGRWAVESSIWSRNPDTAQRQGGGQSGGGPQGGGQPGGGPHGGGQGGRGPGPGARQGGAGGQGGYRQGGGQGGGYRQGGYGGGGGRNRGGIGGQGGGIGGGGGGGARRVNPQGGRGQSLYDDNGGLYSNRDD